MGLSKELVQNTTGHLTYSVKKSDKTLTADLSGSRLDFYASYDGISLYEESLSFGSVSVEVGITEIQLPDNSKAAGTCSPEVCKSARVQLSAKADLQVPKDHEEEAAKIIKALKIEKKLVTFEHYNRSWEDVSSLPDIVCADGIVLKIHIQMKVDTGSITATIKAEESTGWVSRAKTRKACFQVAGQVQVCFRLRFEREGGDNSLQTATAVVIEAANWLMMAGSAAAAAAKYLGRGLGNSV